MAFPGIFNINYYKGDTYEFNVYPKTTSGEPFLMNDYGTSKLTISAGRGSSSIVLASQAATLSKANQQASVSVLVDSSDISKLRVGMLLVKKSGVGAFGTNPRIIAISGNEIILSVEHATAGEIVYDIDERFDSFSEISVDKKYVKCAITPDIAAFMDASKSYVYDVQITKTEEPYDKVFTLLTGQVSITEEVSTDFVVPEVTVEIPNAPTGLTITEDPAGTANLDWTAPATGDAPTSYKVYGKSASVPGFTAYTLLHTVTGTPPATAYSTSSVTLGGMTIPLDSGIQYDIKVTSVNTAGESASGDEESITLTLPGTVVDLEISARDFAAGTATLTWSAPTTGADVTSYVVLYNDDPQLGDGPEDFTATSPLSGSTLTYSFTGLTALTPYAFAVVAYADAVPGTPEVVVDGV